MRALVTQLLEALDESRGDVSQCLQEELPKAGYERYDRRIKAITEQLEKHDAAIKAAREYLATEPSGERAELIKRLAKQWAELDPADPYRADIGQAVSMLEADAQQAKRVPMTDMEIYTVLASTVDGPEPAEELIGCDEWPEIVDMIRLIEAHHGITPADKPTGWDNGLSQDYCAEFGKWLASRPGARQQIKAMFDTSTPLQP